MVDDALGAGQVRLDLGKLRKLAIQFALQVECFAQPRFEASQPCFRVGDAPTLLFQLRSMRSRACSSRAMIPIASFRLDPDRLGEIRPFQN